MVNASEPFEDFVQYEKKLFVGLGVVTIVHSKRFVSLDYFERHVK